MVWLVVFVCVCVCVCVFFFGGGGGEGGVVFGCFGNTCSAEAPYLKGFKKGLLVRGTS